MRYWNGSQWRDYHEPMELPVRMVEFDVSDVVDPEELVEFVEPIEEVVWTEEARWLFQEELKRGDREDRSE